MEVGLMALDPITADMLGPELAEAINAAHAKTKDDTITARIEQHPDTKLPGAHVVARGGNDLQHGMNAEHAIKFLKGLKK
jgi:hypothetical protein